MLFGVIVVALAVHLVVVGLDEADKVASGISAVVALVAVGTPYLLPPPSPGGVPTPEPDRSEDTGAAHATGGGQANTGLQAAGVERPAQIARSGDATADGPGSVANTGVQLRRRA
ncbi:hypothetical protein [Micromonospora nigra]|uniref:hypothetical protein n=1 Tax=Micromonospora nigra TaxID=145857 RepID=UPI000B886EE7|nr:hypothetical protein [Micromonospora nigra]